MNKKKELTTRKKKTKSYIVEHRRDAYKFNFFYYDAIHMNFYQNAYTTIMG